VRDTSGQLQTLVQSFIAQTDPAARTATLDSLLFTWTGSAGLDPASRGGQIDARKLAVLVQVYQSC
jgi:hypothetical protein